MSFPYHDRFWVDSAEFLKRHMRAGETVLAPDIFWWMFDIHRYAHATPERVQDWTVIHKGMLAKLRPDYLRAVLKELRPAFANDVFVILTRRPELPDIGHSSLHVAPLVAAVQLLPEAAVPAKPDGLDAMPSDAETIVKFETLDAGAFRDAMNSFWRSGGYLYTTARDQAYFQEIDHYIADHLGDMTGQTVLDLCCGSGRLKDLAKGARKVVGIDVADAAIALAIERHRGDDTFEFLVMDAAELAFPDASFDVVLFADAIEHVRRIDTVFDEIVRVLKPGGRLFTTVANTDSVNQIMTAKLGYPRFKTNYQHIQEYNLAEFEALARRYGLITKKAGGVFLFPYWGIPGIDEVVRDVVDNDSDLVEMFRRLGRQIGPEHAYAFAVLSVKGV